jgi:hypothetical protein
MAADMGQRVVLAKFTTRTDVEVFE